MQKIILSITTWFNQQQEVAKQYVATFYAFYTAPVDFDGMATPLAKA